MENRTLLNRLIEISHKREDNFAFPVILEHYDLTRNGLNEEDALTVIEDKYNFSK